MNIPKVLAQTLDNTNVSPYGKLLLIFEFSNQMHTKKDKRKYHRTFIGNVVKHTKKDTKTLYRLLKAREKIGRLK